MAAISADVANLVAAAQADVATVAAVQTDVTAVLQQLQSANLTADEQAQMEAAITSLTTANQTLQAVDASLKAVLPMPAPTPPPTPTPPAS